MVGFQVYAIMYRDSLPGQLGIRIGSDDHRLAHQNRYFVRSVGPKSVHKAERIFGDLESVHAACLARSRSVVRFSGRELACYRPGTARPRVLAGALAG